MNFHKTPTDYNNLDTFLPDNMILCNKNYWEKKWTRGCACVATQLKYI